MTGFDSRLNNSFMMGMAALRMTEHNTKAIGTSTP